MKCGFTKTTWVSSVFIFVSPLDNAYFLKGGLTMDKNHVLVQWGVVETFSCTTAWQLCATMTPNRRLKSKCQGIPFRMFTITFVGFDTQLSMNSITSTLPPWGPIDYTDIQSNGLSPLSPCRHNPNSWYSTDALTTFSLQNIEMTA